MLGGISGTFYPHAVITAVYDDTVFMRDNEGNEQSGLGWVQVNLLGFIGETEEIARTQGTVDAMLMMSPALKPTTEETQSSTKKLASPMNQQYGTITPPRVGDKALVVYCRKYFVIGVYPASGGNEPPSYTADDLSIIHRSGASIRLNDKHPGVTAPTPDEYNGITGAMSTVANRAIHLVGSKFLPYGLMAHHASQDVKIDINDESDGYAYTDIFDDAEPSSTTYQPWDASASGKKFVGPPSSDLSGNDVGSDEFYLLHQGGGLLKMAPLNTHYTGTKIAADGMTIAVGTEYWDAGIQNNDTGHSGSAPDSTVLTNVLAFIHGTGASIKIDANGALSLVSADGQDYSITATGTGVVILGSKGKQAIGHGDGTSTDTGLFGYTHSHTVSKSQDEVWIP